MIYAPQPVGDWGEIDCPSGCVAVPWLKPDGTYKQECVIAGTTRKCLRRAPSGGISMEDIDANEAEAEAARRRQRQTMENGPDPQPDKPAKPEDKTNYIPWVVGGVGVLVLFAVLKG